MSFGLRLVWNRSVLIVLASMSLALTACGNEAASPAARAAPELEPITVQFDWLANPGYAPTLLADGRGYFEDEGLDATITEGGAAISATQLLAAGKADIVVGTLDDVPIGVAEGLPLVAVAVMERVTTSSILAPADSGIDSPTDLEGKSIATATVGASGVLLEPFLEASGVDVTQVKISNVEGSAKVPLLISGKVDAITGFGRDEGTQLEVGEGMEMNVFPYSDSGLDMLSLGVYTTQQVIDDKPELVRGAVRAILRGYADAVADPPAAVDAAKAVFPQYYEREDVALAHAVLLGKYMEEQAAPEGFGFQSESDWASTLDLLETYFGLKDPRAPSEYFTNEFLPEDDLLAN